MLQLLLCLLVLVLPLPLVNILLRAGAYPEESRYQDLATQIRRTPKRETLTTFASLVDQGHEEALPNLLGNDCKRLTVGPRFLLTE